MKKMLFAILALIITGCAITGKVSEEQDATSIMLSTEEGTKEWYNSMPKEEQAIATQCVNTCMNEGIKQLQKASVIIEVCVQGCYEAHYKAGAQGMQMVIDAYN